ncbi:hypothetical protein ColTof3_10731 [Colletotrichum tofieldiae]|nr:hypothetical protein ColTof3_10731 [Colletotrichum tofieldiae]GKT89565.1 hypothetical protein Ct61P_07415 [Colletotrichum tofieldiae]
MTLQQDWDGQHHEIRGAGREFRNVRPTALGMTLVFGVCGPGSMISHKVESIPKLSRLPDYTYCE